MSAMTDQERKFLVFSLQNTLYALDLSQVAEVGESQQVWPIPLAPECFSGALNFHGEIVAVMDLAVFLGLSAVGTRPGKLIVLHQEIASLAFFVDAIIRIISGAEVSSRKSSEHDFAIATLSIPNGEVTQLDVEALVLSTGIRMQKSLLDENIFKA